MIKLFVKTVQDSIYSKDFYRNLSNTSIRNSVSYYFILILLAAIVFTIIAGIRLIPAVDSFAKSAGPAAIQMFPDDLVIEIKNGKATHNSDEPVMIPLSAGYDSELPFRYAIVIDTKNEFSLAKFEAYKTLLLLTADSLVSTEARQGQVKVTSLKDWPDMKIDKQKVVYWVNTIQPFLGWAIPITIMGSFIVGLLIFSFNFIRIILATVLIWIFYRFKNSSLTFGRAYQAAIHASTLPFILIGVIGLLFSPFVLFPFAFTLLTIIIAIVNYAPQSPPPASQI